MRTFALGLAVLCLIASGCTHPQPHAAAPRPVPAEYAHVDPAGACKLIDAGQVTVIDLRTPAEFAAGHIAGAQLVDCQAPGFAQTLEKLDHSHPYLVHCASGGRSSRSLVVFRQLGFVSVIHLDGGLHAWEAAGQPVQH